MVDLQGFSCHSKQINIEFFGAAALFILSFSFSFLPLLLMLFPLGLACSLHPPPSRLQMFVPASRCCVFIALNHILLAKLPVPCKHLQRRLLSAASHGEV